MYDDYDCDPREDYEIEISAIIEDEVAKRVTEGIKKWENEISLIKENNQKIIELLKENSQLKSKVNGLNYDIEKLTNDHKKEIEEIKINYNNDYLKTIVGDWKQDEKAYKTIKDEYGYTKCPECHGEGKKKFTLSSGKEIYADCDFCNSKNGQIKIELKKLDYIYTRDLCIYINSGKPFLGCETGGRIKDLKYYTKDKAKLQQEIDDYNEKSKQELKKRHEKYIAKNKQE